MPMLPIGPRSIPPGTPFGSPADVAGVAGSARMPSGGTTGAAFWLVAGDRDDVCGDGGRGTPLASITGGVKVSDTRGLGSWPGTNICTYDTIVITIAWMTIDTPLKMRPIGPPSLHP